MPVRLTYNIQYYENEAKEYPKGAGHFQASYRLKKRYLDQRISVCGKSDDIFNRCKAFDATHFMPTLKINP